MLCKIIIGLVIGIIIFSIITTLALCKSASEADKYIDDFTNSNND